MKHVYILRAETERCEHGVNLQPPHLEQQRAALAHGPRLLR